MNKVINAVPFNPNAPVTIEQAVTAVNDAGAIIAFVVHSFDGHKKQKKVGAVMQVAPDEFRLPCFSQGFAFGNCYGIRSGTLANVISYLVNTVAAEVFVCKNQAELGRLLVKHSK